MYEFVNQPRPIWFHLLLAAALFVLGYRMGKR